MSANQPTASGVSDLERRMREHAQCNVDAMSETFFLLIEAADALSAKPAQTEQIASVRRCVEWAIPQLNCGNMSKDEFFDYLVSLFGTISAHEAVRDIQERWRRDKSERDHLRYVLSREPAQGGERVWNGGKLSRIQAVRILDHATDKDDPYWEGVVEDFYDEKSDTMPTIMDVLAALGVTEAEYREASGADNLTWPTPSQPIPTPDEAGRESKLEHQAMVCRQHIGWLKMYAKQMHADDWRDAKSRIETQLAGLTEDFHAFQNLAMSRVAAHPTRGE